MSHLTHSLTVSGPLPQSPSISTRSASHTPSNVSVFPPSHEITPSPSARGSDNSAVSKFGERSGRLAALATISRSRWSFRGSRRSLEAKSTDPVPQRETRAVNDDDEARSRHIQRPRKLPRISTDDECEPEIEPPHTPGGNDSDTSVGGHVAASSHLSAKAKRALAKYAMFHNLSSKRLATSKSSPALQRAHTVTIAELDRNGNNGKKRRVGWRIGRQVHPQQTSPQTARASLRYESASKSNPSDSAVSTVAPSWDNAYPNSDVKYLCSDQSRFTQKFLDRDLERRWHQHYRDSYSDNIRRALAFTLSIWTVAGIVSDVTQKNSSTDYNRFYLILSLRLWGIICMILSTILLRPHHTHSRWRWLDRFSLVQSNFSVPYQFTSAMMMMIIAVFEIIIFALQDDTTATMLVLLLILLPSMSATTYRHDTIICAVLCLAQFLLWLAVTLIAGTYDSPLRFGLICLGILGIDTVLIGRAYEEEMHGRREFLSFCHLQQEEEVSQQLLLKMLPLSIIAKLRNGAEYVYEKHDSVSVLFTHIHDFDLHTASMQPLQLVKTLNRIFSMFDALTDEHRVYKVETIGDVFLVCSGCPTEYARIDHAAALCLLAVDMMEVIQSFLVTHDETRRSSLWHAVGHSQAVQPIDTAVLPPWPVKSLAANDRRQSFPSLSRSKLDLRIGINTGPVIAGVVGRKHPRYRLMGDTINTASRMSTTCTAGEIQINSSTFAQLNSSDFICESRVIDVKGKGRMETFIVKGHKLPHRSSATAVNAVDSPMRPVNAYSATAREYLPGPSVDDSSTSSSLHLRSKQPFLVDNDTFHELNANSTQINGELEATIRAKALQVTHLLPPTHRISVSSAGSSVGSDGDRSNAPSEAPTRAVSKRTSKVNSDDREPRLSTQVSFQDDPVNVTGNGHWDNTLPTAQFNLNFADDSNIPTVPQTRSSIAAVDSFAGTQSLTDANAVYDSVTLPQPNPLSHAVSAPPAPRQYQVPQVTAPLGVCASFSTFSNEAHTPSSFDRDSSTHNHSHDPNGSPSNMTPRDGPAGSDNPNAVNTLRMSTLDSMRTDSNLRTQSPTAVSGALTARSSYPSPPQRNGALLMPLALAHSGIQMSPGTQWRFLLPSPSMNNREGTHAHRISSHGVTSTVTESDNTNTEVDSTHITDADTGTDTEGNTRSGNKHAKKSLTASSTRSRGKSKDVVITANSGRVKTTKMFTYGNLSAIMDAPRPWTSLLSQTFLGHPELESQFRFESQARLLDIHERWLRWVFVATITAIVCESVQNPAPSLAATIIVWLLRVLLLATNLVMLKYLRNEWVVRNSTPIATGFSLCVCIVFIVSNRLLDLFNTVYGYVGILMDLCVAITCTGLPLSHASLLVFVAFAVWIVLGLAFDGTIGQEISIHLCASLVYLTTAYYSEYRDRLTFLRFLKHENEKTTTKQFLNNLLPKQVIDSLTAQRLTFIAHDRMSADVLFCDVVQFTRLAARSSPEDVVAILNVLFSSFDAMTDKYHIYKVETIGDAYLACSGVVEEREDHTKNLVECGLAMRRATRLFRTPDHEPIVVRIGIHTGFVIAGVVGRKMPRYHLFGETVSIAEEMEQRAPAGQVTISETTFKALTEQQLKLFDFAPLDPIKIAAHPAHNPSPNSLAGHEPSTRVLKRFMVRSARSAQLQRERQSRKGAKQKHQRSATLLTAAALSGLNDKLKGLSMRGSSLLESSSSALSSDSNRAKQSPSNRDRDVHTNTNTTNPSGTDSES